MHTQLLNFIHFGYSRNKWYSMAEGDSASAASLEWLNMALNAEFGSFNEFGSMNGIHCAEWHSFNEWDSVNK